MQNRLPFPSGPAILLLSLVLLLAACDGGEASRGPDAGPADVPADAPGDEGRPGDLPTADLPLADAPPVGDDGDVPPAPGAVEGRVTVFALGPAAGAAVQVDGLEGAVQADADGRYAIPGIPAGPRTVVATLVPYAPAQVAVDVPAGGTATAPDLVVHHGRPLAPGPDVLPVAFSPDGSRLAFLKGFSFVTGVGDLWIADTATGQAVEAGRTVFFQSLAFSPGGRRLLFLSRFAYSSGTGDLNCWDLQQGKSVHLASGAVPTGLLFDASESRVAALSDLDPGTGLGTMKVYDLDTGEATPVAASVPAGLARLLPDGRGFLYAGNLGPDQVGDLALWEFEGGASTPLASGVFAPAASWDPDPASARLLFYSGWDATTNRGTLNWWEPGRGTPLVLGEGVGPDLLWTSNGWQRIAFFEHAAPGPDDGRPVGRLKAWTLGEAGEAAEVAATAHAERLFFWNGDRRVFFTAPDGDRPGKDRAGSWDFQQRQATWLSAGRSVGLVVPSDDGSRVAWLADVDPATARGELWVHGAGGEAPEGPRAAGVAWDLLRFSPSGRWLLAKGGPDAGDYDPATFLGTLRALDLQGDGEQVLGTKAASVAFLSPDDRFVAFVGGVEDLADYAGDVRLWRLDEGHGVVLAPGSTSDAVEFLPGGRHALFRTACDPVTTRCGLKALELPGSGLEAIGVKDLAADVSFYDPYRLSPDGAAVAFSDAVPGGDGRGPLSLYRFGDGEATVLAQGSDASTVTFGPGGRFMTFLAAMEMPRADLWFWDLQSGTGDRAGQGVLVTGIRSTADWSRFLFLQQGGGETGDLGTLRAYQPEEARARDLASGVPYFSVNADADLSVAAWLSAWDAGTSTGRLEAARLDGDPAPVPLEDGVQPVFLFHPDRVAYVVPGDGAPRRGLWVADLPAAP